MWFNLQGCMWYSVYSRRTHRRASLPDTTLWAGGLFNLPPCVFRCVLLTHSRGTKRLGAAEFFSVSRCWATQFVINPVTMRKGILLLFALVAIIVQLPAQTLDILIKNGHVIDAKNGRDGVMDVAIRDEKIVLVAPSIDQPATQVIDASGMYVVSGLIDIHGHHFFGTEPDRYLSNGFSALPPDGFTLRSGVTTVVDVGGAGWRNFATFKAPTIDQSTTRVLSFLNIVGGGMSGGQREQNIEDMDAAMTAKVAKENKEYVVGIKLAHFEGNTWVPTERAVEAGRLANIPVMVDFGGSDPPLSLETLFMDKLRPGDIFTHCYAHVKGRMPL